MQECCAYYPEDSAYINSESNSDSHYDPHRIGV